MSVAPCRPKKNEFAWQIIGSQVVFLRLRLHRLGPHLGCPVFCFFDVQVKTKNSLQNYIYMLYILITIIQRSAVFRRSDIHPATCTLPSLRQAPAVFSFAARQPPATLLIPFAMNLGLTLSSSWRLIYLDSTVSRAPFSADLRSTPSQSRIGIRIYINIIYIYIYTYTYIFKKVASESSSRCAACKSIAQRRW